MTPFERVVGDSSKDHTVTAPTFTTRPTTEQLHHYAGRHCRQVDLIRAAIQPEGDALTGPVELGAIKVINELNTILRAMR